VAAATGLRRAVRQDRARQSDEGLFRDRTDASVYSRYFLITGETAVTPRGLKLFIRLCELGAMRRRCRPRTVAGHVAALYKMLRLLHSDRDHRVLGRLARQMLALAARTPKRRAAATPAARVLPRRPCRPEPHDAGSISPRDPPICSV